MVSAIVERQRYSDGDVIVLSEKLKGTVTTRTRLYHVPLHRVLAFFNMIAAIVDVMYPADLGSAKPPAGFENTRA